MPSLSGQVETVPKRLVEAFLLRAPEEVVRARDTAQHAAIVRLNAAARVRMQVARDLHEPTEAVAAVTLYREAAVLLIAALKQATQRDLVDPKMTPEQAWQAFDALSLPAAHGPQPEGFAGARALLATSDALAADAVPAAELSAVTANIADVVGWLGSAVEPRTVREIRATRMFRIAGVAMLLAYVAYKIVGGAVSSKNIALNKPALASSQRPATPLASGVVNGEIEHAYGVHTNVELNPWVRVDLGAPVAVHEVRVYNRGDGWQSEILPLVLQLSDDGRVWTDLARRDVVFTQDDPWVTKLSDKRGRYVRVTLPGNGYIALAEIQVF